MKLVGSIYHFFPGYIDHIAPLCSLLDIPIVVTEKKFYDQIKIFYPNLEIILHEDYLTYCNFLVSNYDLIISCQMLYTDPVTMTLLQMSSSNFTIAWLPHGHSDKGHDTEIFKSLEKEKITLVYGNKMLDTFKKQDVYHKIQNKITLGNYRKHYWKKHQSYYEKIIKNQVKAKLDKNNKTILYAPTWEDYEKNGSYNNVISTLLETLPDKYNLIVKPHHNTYIKNNAQLLRLHSQYEDHPNVLFLKDFPSIYPLINFADIYLGDMSSIGYDFLSLNKPMFFLNNNSRNSKKDPGLYLYQTGIEIGPDEYNDIYNIITKKTREDRYFKDIRKEVESYTFGDIADFKALKTQLKTSV